MPSEELAAKALELFLKQQAAELQSENMSSEAAAVDTLQVTELEAQPETKPAAEVVAAEASAEQSESAADNQEEAQQEGEAKPKSKGQLMRMRRAALKKAAAEAAAAEAEAAGREQGDAAEEEADKGMATATSEDKGKGKATAASAKGAKAEGTKTAVVKGVKATDAKPPATPAKNNDKAAVTPIKKEGPKAKSEPSANKKNARSRPTSEDDEPSTKKQKSETQPKNNKIEKTSKIYVGGLPPVTNADDLRECFAAVGPIRRLDFKVTFAFIDFEQSTAAQLAVERYHLGYFMDHQIRVELATAGHDKASGGAGGKPTLQPNAKSGFSAPAGAAASGPAGKNCFKCGKPGHKLKDCRSTVDIRGPRTPAHQWQPNQQPAPFYPAVPFGAPAYGPPNPQAYQPYAAPPYGYPAYGAPQQWYGPPQQGQAFYPQPQPQGAYPQQQQQVQGAYPQQPLVNGFVPQGPVEQRSPAAFNGPQSGRGAQRYDRPPHQDGSRAFQPQPRLGGAGSKK